MPSLRRQITQDPLSAPNEGRHTSGRSARFIQTYMASGGSSLLVGGCQSVSWDESNGSRYMAQIGNDLLELNPGVRSISGSIRRWQIRGGDFRQMLNALYPGVGDTDFRELPFDLYLHFIFQSASGGTTFEDQWWILHDLTVTTYGFSVPDQTSLLEDNVSFISRGVESWNNKGSKIQPNQLLFGSTSSTPSGNQVI